MKRMLAALTVSLLGGLASCETGAPVHHSSAQLETVRVITPDQVDYQPLNPARGDASPQAGVLWGDIREDVPSGVLLKFAEGFSSPPHIHNITYRAVVISGEVHNDDPEAANMWMGPGTFWTQPAGEVHITSARPGLGGTAFLEILEGPYLVQPGDLAFDNGERPLNLLSSNMMWMTADEFNWIDADANGPQVALLWGDLSASALSGSMLKLPAGFAGALWSEGDAIRAVTIQGELTHSVNGLPATTRLEAGGYFSSDQDVQHILTCEAQAECLVYVRTTGQFRVK
ncbi:MAG: DUF4437 domain-containing protein [Pseudomonadota bacterium]